MLTPPKGGDRRKVGKLGEEAPTPTEESETLNPVPVTELELKRPTALRPPKKNKNWEEEVEEESPKAAKAANKSKRGARSQTILDDDEDVLDELDLNVLPAGVQVSLSIARPPKPKGRTATAAPAATVAAPAMAKTKKPGASRDRSDRSSGVGKREEVAPKRPDKLVLSGSMTVQELAQELAIPDTEIIKRLFMYGIAVNLTQNLDVPTITIEAT
ncbi:MAG TPA: translation initiation factor IF-2, partial [Cyanobacteria bacterium UBA11372]|nr:translation initiation factor IF-2 [Cyanobacteria bacterium UBA11372]